MTKRTYTKEILEQAVEASESIMGVLRHLGLAMAGGTHSHIKNKIIKYNIDTSHFTGAKWNVGIAALNKKSWEQVLILRPEGSSRLPAKQLRRAMLESGIEFLCVLCGKGDVWNGLPLMLEVDHIDGNWLDSRKENVRFLCPNCHSQQKTSNRPHKYRK